LQLYGVMSLPPLW